MALPVMQTSFAAGELSPALNARVDLAKFQIGAALMENFFVDYRGGASNCPGSRFVAPCKAIDGRPRLIPFTVSTAAAYVVEVGNLYMRFYANAGVVENVPGTPFEVVTPYLTADIPLLKYTQSADVLTITHPSYPVYNLRRTSSTTFTLTPG